VPFASKSQQRFAHANPKKFGGASGLKEWDSATDFTHLPEKKPMAGGWMSDEADRQKSAGTKGAFSGAAAKAGKTTAQYADEKQDAPGKVGKRARMAKMFMGAKKG